VLRIGKRAKREVNMSYKEDVTKSAGGNFLMLNGEYPHKVVFPNAKGVTVFRPYPEVKDGVEVPWRNSPSDFDFSGWVTARRMIRNGGRDGRLTCLTAMKGAPVGEWGPLDKFTFNLSKALKDTPRRFPEDWESWPKYRATMPKGGPSFLKLPRVAQAMMVQGALITLGGLPVLNDQKQPEPSHPMVLCLSESGRQSMEAICNARDTNGSFVASDVCSTTKGRALIVTNIPAVLGKTVQRYEITLDPEPMPLDLSFVAAEYVPWEKLLYYMTAEQQVNTLLEHYPVEAVDIGLRETKFYGMLPNEIHGSFERMGQTTVNYPPPRTPYQQSVQISVPQSVQPAAPQPEHQYAPAVGKPKMAAQTPVSVAPSPFVGARPTYAATPVNPFSQAKPNVKPNPQGSQEYLGIPENEIPFEGGSERASTPAAEPAEEPKVPTPIIDTRAQHLARVAEMKRTMQQSMLPMVNGK
jgi:hypothetical protein